MAHAEPPRAGGRASSAAARRPLGVLLANLGTPASPSVADVKRFLDEFLSDPAVVKFPRFVWLPLLRGIILPRRAPKSAHAYASIWTERGSPLLVYTRTIAAELELALANGGHAGARVEIAMRYGTPSLADGMRTLAERGAGRALVVPLYPQFSGTTTGTTLSKLDELDRADPLPLRWSAVRSFADDAGYIGALAARVHETCAAQPPQHYVFSFHGIPVRYARAGDPYETECQRTADALAAKLGLARDTWTLAYQSRFGPEKWLGPATRDVVLALARRKVKCAVVLPGFATDCLETLEEIGKALAEEVHAAGGPELTVVPALNAHPVWVSALADLVRRSADAAPGS